MTQAVVVFGAALLGLFTGIVTTSWQTRKHLEAEYDLDLRKSRIEVYRELWKRLEPLAMYSGSQRLTFLAASELSQNLTQWYYETGGLFISEQTREPYFDVQNALKGILARRGDRAWTKTIDGKSTALLKALASRLRTSMTDDVATRVKPRLGSSFSLRHGRLPLRHAPDVRVTVRRGWNWTAKPVEGYLVTVENRSHVEATDLASVRFEVDPPVEVPERARGMRLPYRIQPRGKWEGWLAADRLGANPLDIGRLAAADVSGGRTIKSEPADESPVGFGGRLERKPARER